MCHRGPFYRTNLQGVMSSIIHLSRITRGQSSGKLIVKTQTLLNQLQLGSCPTDKILLGSSLSFKNTYFQSSRHEGLVEISTKRLRLASSKDSPRELRAAKPRKIVDLTLIRGLAGHELAISSELKRDSKITLPPTNTKM